jgi:hypothetical protein
MPTPGSIGGHSLHDFDQDWLDAISNSTGATSGNPFATLADASSVQVVTANFQNPGALKTLTPFIVPTGFEPKYLHCLIGSTVSGANMSVGIATSVGDQAYVNRVHWNGGDWGAGAYEAGKIGRTQQQLAGNITEYTLTQMDNSQIQITSADIASGHGGDFAKITVIGTGLGGPGAPSTAVSYNQFSSVLIGPGQPAITVNPGFEPQIVYVSATAYEISSNAGSSKGWAVGTGGTEMHAEAGSGAFLHTHQYPGKVMYLINHSVATEITAEITSFTSSAVTIGNFAYAAGSTDFNIDNLFITVIG